MIALCCVQYINYNIYKNINYLHLHMRTMFLLTASACVNSGHVRMWVVNIRSHVHPKLLGDIKYLYLRYILTLI